MNTGILPNKIHYLNCDDLIITVGALTCYIIELGAVHSRPQCCVNSVDSIFPHISCNLSLHKCLDTRSSKLPSHYNWILSTCSI